MRKSRRACHSGPGTATCHSGRSADVTYPETVVASRAFAHAPQRSRGRPDSAGNVKKADLLRMRVVERMNRLGGRLQQDRAALFRKIRLSFRRYVHIAHLTRANNYLLASVL